MNETRKHQRTELTLEQLMEATKRIGKIWECELKDIQNELLAEQGIRVSKTAVRNAMRKRKDSDAEKWRKYSWYRASSGKSKYPLRKVPDIVYDDMARPVRLKTVEQKKTYSVYVSKYGKDPDETGLVESTPERYKRVLRNAGFNFDDRKTLEKAKFPQSGNKKRGYPVRSARGKIHYLNREQLDKFLRKGRAMDETGIRIKRKRTEIRLTPRGMTNISKIKANPVKKPEEPSKSPMDLRKLAKKAVPGGIITVSKARRGK